ncbi:MAG: type II secretion system protein GspF [Deltaproteobacteria bacterium]|nr:MAG: type II secretion system protein GspF [Deltaproteobacteria bacterium]
MPVYEYTGLNAAGKTVKGIRDADSPRTLRSMLKREGIFVTGYVEEGTRKGTKDLLSTDVDLKRRIRGYVSAQDLAIMNRQLATLVGSGVPLVDALNALQEQVDHPTLKRVVGAVKQRVNEGASLADALEDHPKIFNHIFVNMVRAGESSGALDIVLQRLAEFQEGQAQLRSKVISALIYPVLMMVIGTVILTILMTVVVPKVTEMFDDIDATLPWTTQVLIAIAGIARDYWWILLGALVVFGLLFRWWIHTERGRERWDRFKLRMPIFGPVIQMIAMARFTRTLATLLKSGVPILSALNIVRNVVDNTVLAAVIDEAREAIQEGEPIATPLKRSGEFPPLVYHMVAIGEKSGQLEEMLMNVAIAYEGQVNTRLQGLTALLEPVMIVGMGGVVAFIVFSILMPILKLNTAIQG